MTYGIQLWGSAKIFNLNIFQAFESINLRLITRTRKLMHLHINLQSSI
jgi:hypothetical protein